MGIWSYNINPWRNVYSPIFSTARPARAMLNRHQRVIAGWPWTADSMTRAGATSLAPLRHRDAWRTAPQLLYPAPDATTPGKSTHHHLLSRHLPTVPDLRASTSRSAALAPGLRAGIEALSSLGSGWCGSVSATQCTRSGSALSSRSRTWWQALEEPLHAFVRPAGEGRCGDDGATLQGNSRARLCIDPSVGALRLFTGQIRAARTMGRATGLRTSLRAISPGRAFHAPRFRPRRLLPFQPKRAKPYLYSMKRCNLLRARLDHAFTGHRGALLPGLLRLVRSADASPGSVWGRRAIWSCAMSTSTPPC